MTQGRGMRTITWEIDNGAYIVQGTGLDPFLADWQIEPIYAIIKDDRETGLPCEALLRRPSGRWLAALNPVPSNQARRALCLSCALCMCVSPPSL